jgi:hypothetical protein
LYAAGTDQDVYYSSDNGTTWDLVHNGENVATFYEIQFFDNDSALICGSQGRMLKYTPLLDSPSNEFSEINMVYNRLDQVLQINSQNTSIVEVQIYSVIGQTVKTERSASATSVNVDVASLAKGVYLVILETNNGSISRRFIKM